MQSSYRSADDEYSYASSAKPPTPPLENPAFAEHEKVFVVRGVIIVPDFPTDSIFFTVENRLRQ